jgi:hypothetical protein
MRIRTFLLSLASLFFLSGCSDANVSVLGMLNSSSKYSPPGFSVETNGSGALTGGGMTLRARVSPLGVTTLSGGGMTLTQGVVR